MCCMMMHEMEHSGHAAGHTQDESLLDVLKRRYALGEITREQFEEMKRVLGFQATTFAPPPAEHEHH